MPQTGPDLVGAGYPISRPMAALLGGLQNVAQPNVSPRTNMDFNLGQLVDGTATASPGGTMLSVAVPVLPGDVITNISFLVGSTSLASANITNQWAALYSGTGSAPGTAATAPALIAQTASSNAAVASANPLTLTFATPQTITQTQAPYGFVYVSYSATLGAGTWPSLGSMTAASAVAYRWFTNGPVMLGGTHNASVGSAAPATMSNVTRVSQVPVVFLY